MTLPVLFDKNVPPFGRYERHPLPFPVPDLRLVCATRLDDTIAFLRTDHTLRTLGFGAEGLRVADVAANYFHIVSGGHLSSLDPGPLTTACAYLQSRRLVVYDIAKRECASHIVTDVANLEEMAASAAWIAHAPGVLAVQIEDTTRYDDGIVDFRLRSFDVSGKDKRALGVLELGASPPRDFRWHCGQGLVVVIRKGDIEVRGPDLGAPIDHPLVAITRALLENEGERLVDLRIHPTQPWAILVTAPEDPPMNPVRHLSHVAWDEPRARWTHVATTLPEGRLEFGEVSVDGDYLALTVEANRRTRLYVIPFRAAASEPFALGLVMGIRARCFTRAPAAFVVFDAAGMVHRFVLT
jgi:hypothetical protein